MDLLTIVIIAGVGLVVLGLVAFMLSRAWGDFPKTSALPGGPPQSTRGEPGRAEPPGLPADDDLEPLEPRELPAGAPEGSLIAVEEPMVRRAIEAAMQKGGSPYVTYFLRHGDTIYVNVGRIADPEQRERITRLIRDVNGKGLGDISMVDSFRAIQELTRLR